jgi:tetratricopeptide (TPR) repeat protein
LPLPAAAAAQSPAPEGSPAPLPAAPDRKDRLVGSEVSPRTVSVGWYESRDGKAVRGGTFDNLSGTVVGVAPDYFLVHWRGREGWVKREDVVVGAVRTAYFAERVRQNPSDAFAQRMCAQALLSAKQVDSARPYVEAAASLAPQDIVARQTRGVFLAMKGDRAGALDEFAAAERIDASDPRTYALRALTLWAAQGEVDKAAADFDTALRLAPNDESLYTMRAMFWLYRGDRARALADVDTCIRLWPDFLAAHVMRVELLANSPDPSVLNPKEAVVSARRACELTRWEDSGHLRRLARACELAGDKDEATRWREKAEQMERDSAAQLPPLGAKP